MKTTLIVIGSILAALIIFRKIMMRKMANTPAVKDHEKILTLTEENINKQTKNKIVLIDFWASWCAPCKMMAPVLNNVAAELPSTHYVGKVNIETYQSLAKKYKVRNIPTLILLKNGVEVNRFVGIKTKEYLLQQLSEVK